MNFNDEQSSACGQMNSCNSAIGSTDGCGVEPVKAIRTQVNIPANRSFGNALEHLKRGSKITRHGWNGKGMWIELQRPDRNSKMTLPYVFLCYPRDDERNGGARVPWLASQTDMLAEDWAVLPD